MKNIFISATGFTAIAALAFCTLPDASATEANSDLLTEWQSPPQEILDVLYAPQLPWVWTSPSGENLFMLEPFLYPSLAELSAPMYKLAGIRVNPVLNSVHGRHGGKSPRIMSVDGGDVIQLEELEGSEVHRIIFTADGEHFALMVDEGDHLGLWTGSVAGDVHRIDDLSLNPLMGESVRWMPDQERLVVLSIPERGPEPVSPAIPSGPQVSEGDGAVARSTYEARDLLQTAHDDALFDYYCQSEITVVDPASGSLNVIGEAAHYYNAEFSPDGEYILVEKLVGPWSHEVAWWRFAREIEVWTSEGERVATVTSLPLADAVPTHGVPMGPRAVQWRATAPHELFWVEALDGGDPVAEVPFRDKLMRLDAPFNRVAEEVYRAEHRILTSEFAWGEQDGMLVLGEYERMRRWYYVKILDLNTGTSRVWFDRDVGDRYGDPGSPENRMLSNGQNVMRQRGNSVYFTGNGSTEHGDRPFLDLRSLDTGESERLFRSDADHYQSFQAFTGSEDRFVLRSESSLEVPNYYLVSIGEEIEAPDGEATRANTIEPLTYFEDPTPQLREIEKRIVQFEREDGVPLSFYLYLPPNYVEGTRLPTVLDAYPMEYSGAGTAGQIRGSTQRFMRLYGSSYLYFLLQGYAVLAQTSMPMIGDPETTYDTFVPQLIADAEAAVAKAVAIGVADPDRIGIIGHSHGALMVANLLAHTDLFRAGIARSGSYNKTNQPFGFQSERRSLFEARDVYINLSPTFFADEVNEPILIIHGDDDSNPGTRTGQSEVFYEAVRGSGGTARLVLLPHEDHGYRACESIEHVIWEQLRWFNMYLKE